MAVDEIEHAVALLRQGKLVAFPTETVYGLGADATNAAAVAKIFAVKGRPSTNPLICHVAGVEVARRYAAHWPSKAQKIADAFWPGPITLVVKKTLDVCDLATAGGKTVGLRSPDHPLALDLLRRFDRPLAGPSANRSTRVSPTTAQHVRDELGNAVDFVLDGGPCSVGIESTVLDVTADPPAILRPGGISRAQIEALIGPVTANHHLTSPSVAATSPGQQAVHYAPQTPAYRFETNERPLIDARGNIVLDCGPDPIAYARTLYDRLRSLDSLGLAAIYVEMPPDEPRWLAVRDRLLRATQSLPIDPRRANT